MSKPKAKSAGPWPPSHLMLPDDLKAIEAGRPAKSTPVADQSRAARLRRLVGNGRPQR